MQEHPVDQRLEKFRVGSVPSVFYIPNFISKEEEEELLQNIYSQPSKQWTNLSNRRLQNYGGKPHEKGMFAQPLPKWLDELGEKFIKEYNIFPKLPNHVLVNEYKPKQGIMAHKDGPVYVPIVANLSLKSPVLITFEFDKFLEEKPKVEKFSLLLEPRALVVFRDSVYHDYLHHIEESDKIILKEEDCIVNLHLTNYKLGDIIPRDLRISSTHRIVKKVIKSKFIKL